MMDQKETEVAHDGLTVDGVMTRHCDVVPVSHNSSMTPIEIAREVVAMADHARQERGGEDSDIERLAREVLRLRAELDTVLSLAQPGSS